MADDVATPSNPPISLVEKEKLEEAPLDVKVFQQSREEEPSRRMVCTQVNRSAWDRQLSPNPHALVIYLEFVPTCGAAPERFEECQCENDDVRLHCRTWVFGDGHYHWLQGPINPLPWSIESNTELAPFVAFWSFCNYDLSIQSCLLSYLLSFNSGGNVNG
jgi:hypothetical protein